MRRTMPEDRPVFTGIVAALVVLDGVFATVKNHLRTGPAPAAPVADPPCRPGSAGTGRTVPGIAAFREARGWMNTVMNGTGRAGARSLAAFVAVAVVSGLVLLFVDLPLPAMAGLGIVFIVSAAIPVQAVHSRRARTGRAPEAAGKKASPVQGPGPVSPGPREREASPRNIPGAEEVSPALLDRYWVAEPWAYVTIEPVRNEGFTYIVSEPAISRKEQTILAETYTHLRDIIIYDKPENELGGIDPSASARIIRQFDPAIADDRVAVLDFYIRRDLSGYGPLDVLMRDPALEDISCNGHGLPVFVFHRAHGSLPTNISFTAEELNRFVLRLAQKANKHISLSNPMADATLPGGARVQITYSDVVSTRGSSFTIRKFRADPMTPLDLIRFGTYNAETLAFLWLAVEHRKSLLVVGGTASGKTSMMNAVSLFIPQNAKVVSLEDTREIQLPHRNWLPTRTRELHAEGVKGDIDLFSLLKACMRQRPEYIIVGEVRGREAQTLFQAMNSGHATLSTIHAGSVHEAINRLTHDPINVPPVMFQALDLVVVQTIYTLGNTRIRRCLSIHEIEVNREGEIHPVPLFEWDVRTDTFRRQFSRSKVLDEIAFHCGWDTDELERQLKRREAFFATVPDGEPPGIRELANAIHGLGG